MNKLFVFVQGRPGLAGGELWAALESGLVELCSGPGARHIRRAAASAAIAGATAPGITVSAYDGTLELWFAGPGRMDATGSDPVWRGRLDEMLGRLTITERTILLATQEVLQLDRGHGKVKVVGLAHRSERFATHDEWVSYWRDVHSPLAHGIPEVTRHYMRYVHNYVLSAAYGTGGENPPFDGIGEEWFASVEDYGACLAEPEYVARIAPDDAAFLDLPRSHVLITTERVVFNV